MPLLTLSVESIVKLGGKYFINDVPTMNTIFSLPTLAVRLMTEMIDCRPGPVGDRMKNAFRKASDLGDWLMPFFT